MDRARGFGPRGWGFESLWARQGKFMGMLAQLAEPQFVELVVTGSSPVHPPMELQSFLAVT